ncbi:MAG: lysoplasmalogenase family protein [Bacillota bacterium]|nr:lysoplasmalogenase family protein [Bacillota bacterium]
MILITVISVLYGILALVTIGVMYRNRQGPYTVLKTVTSLLFLLVGFLAYRHTGNPLYFYLLPGFIFCFLGDVLLAVAHEIDNKLKNPYFVLGVGSFLVAHVFFCWQFLGILEWHISWPAVIAIIMTGVTVSSVRSEKYDYGPNKIPSIIYSFFVGLLCGLGLQLFLDEPSNGQLIFLGAGSVLFLVSDYLLSMKYFRIEKPKCLGFFVLVAYYGAMWLLSANILMA